MRQGLSRRAFARSAAATAGTCAVLRHPRGQEALTIRCSLDTAPSHARNRAIVDYLRRVEDATGGQVSSQVFHSGQLYADLDVATALLQGRIDMAAPGAWTQTGIVPDCDFCQLPVFYGQRVAVTDRASDGKPGALIVRQIESALRVHVIGPWIDLGLQNWYTTKRPIGSLDDIRGLRIRSAGGAGVSWRIGFCGGIPVATAWPGAPTALSRGRFDGLVSTNESCASARLWEAGVRYSYQDHQSAGQYIPMISRAFWAKLTPDVQKIMADLWITNISGYRADALAAQARARRMMADNGVRFVDPAPAVLAETRKRMQADVASLVRDARLSPDVVRLSEGAANGPA